MASGFARPVDVAVRDGDAALYLAEQPGRVWRVDGGTVASTPLLDLSEEVSGGFEQGIQGIVFAPGGALFYVHYTDRDGDSRLLEYALAGARVDPVTRREVLVVEQPFANHNGAGLVFGPDGMLYVAQGDGGDGDGKAGDGEVVDPFGHGQNRGSLLGTILRIDPRPDGARSYSVPADNPFVGDPRACPEIWMWGLRNPWRFSFDRLTGDVWIGDTGHKSRESICFAPAGDQAGANWGWANLEGSLPVLGRPRPPDARDPIYEYGRDEGVSVIGGHVYRGSRIPALYGAYVFADYGRGDLVALRQESGVLVSRRFLGLHADGIVSLGENHDGELYVVAQSADEHGGRLLRLDPT